MNILFLTHNDDLLGSSRSLLNLLDGLRNHEIKPYVVIDKEGLLQKELEARGIPYGILPLVWWMTDTRRSLRVWFNFVTQLLPSLRPFVQLIKEWQIDLVYSNSSVFPVGSMAALIKQIPHIWHVREFGDLDFSLKYIPPGNLCLKFIRKSSHVIYNSSAVRNHYNLNANKNQSVIYNGIASRAQYDAYRVMRSEVSREPIFTFLIIGSISPRKGQASAISAVARLKEIGIPCQLIVVGTGPEPYVASLHRLTENLGISDSVIFTGLIENPYEVFMTSDCLLMCSTYEAFGRVTTEAMSACLPVIGKNSGGTPEIIVHGETGFLYNSDDELVEYMTRMATNPELGYHMGLAGWQRAKHLFNIEDYAARVFNVIQSVIRR